MLSGGERNRLLLARLVRTPSQHTGPRRTDQRSRHRIARAPRADTAGAIDGTLLLVSHDRTFLDNVVTQVVARAEGDGRWKEYVGGYSGLVATTPCPQPGAHARARTLPGTKASSERPRPRRAGLQHRRPAQCSPPGSSATRKHATSTNCPSRIEALEAEQRALDRRDVESQRLPQAWRGEQLRVDASAPP